MEEESLPCAEARVSKSLCLLMVALACAACGCATARHEAYAPAPCPCDQGLILVANGAGGFEVTSQALRDAVAADGLPLGVETLDWTHGFGRFFADQMDYEHARLEGQQLAERIRARRQACPCGRIYLVAHSAGAAVVLAAAECLPPDSVDDIVLLSPAISADYDLRAALRGSRRGIDVFYSQRDLAYLGLGVSIVGTTDREWSAAAGRVGFRPVIANPEDAALHAKLRQHAWDCSVRWTGNAGGHHGASQPGFLRAYVLPLLTADQPGNLTAARLSEPPPNHQ
jgi:pimeloyl-ACP methyl ester carboxylesterase